MNATLQKDVREQVLDFTEDVRHRIGDEATRLAGDLRDRTTHGLEQAREFVEKADAPGQVRRLTHEHPWLPFAAGLGLVIAIILLTRPR